MTKRNFMVITILVFTLTAAGIGALILLPNDIFSPETRETHQTKVVIPRAMGGGASPGEGRDGQNSEANVSMIDFKEGESVISVLNRDFDGDAGDEQIIAYRNQREVDTPVFITYVDFDVNDGQNKRIWTAPTAATRPGTLILYSEDLIGDGGVCVLAAGMNGSGEQTLTVFRKNGFPEPELNGEPFSKIAEFIIEGSITVQERNYRNQGEGKSLSIATYGRDYDSENLLDQIEVTYTYNRVNGLYEQAGAVKIPGSQIEQRRLQELLSGEPGQFEEFITGLWYLVSDSKSQYVYFNTENREMIFYSNDSEEVFSWQDANPTRYGLHIIGKNNSLTKLRRTVNIELQSLESIRLRVFQDIYLRSGPGTVWDGSYQRVKSASRPETVRNVPPHQAGVYKGAEGQISLYRDGSYEMVSGEGISANIERGKYVFFNMENQEILELRPEIPQEGKDPVKPRRETFKVNRIENDGEETLTLIQVQMGTRGIQELHEAPVSLVKTADLQAR
ncbi:MAG: pallilysin-related adhesin [Treponema sp.]|jgi:hypothetical protein|nr:pallilysin-related adhesin [Treponema sp.]